MKTILKITLMALFIFSVNIAFSQITWGSVTSEITNAENNFKLIIKVIAGLVLGIGFVYLLWSKITGKSDSNDKLIGVGVAIAAYLIAIGLGLF